MLTIGVAMAQHEGAGVLGESVSCRARRALGRAWRVLPMGFLRLLHDRGLASHVPALLSEEARPQAVASRCLLYGSGSRGAYASRPGGFSMPSRCALRGPSSWFVVRRAARRCRSRASHVDWGSAGFPLYDIDIKFEKWKNGFMPSSDEAATPAVPFSVSHKGHVATLTISNPRRKNAIGQAAWTALRNAFLDIAASNARVLVLTGEGDDFCAGADLSARGDRHALIGMQEVNEACLALHRVRMPVICRVDGYAVGAGMNLALAGDFVIASDRARFAQIFVKRGLSVDFGGSWLLPRLVGLHRAKEMVLLGEMLDAATLHRLGIVRQVVAPEELDGAVAVLAEQLAAGPPIALAQSKRLLNDAFESSLESSLEAEARAQAVNLAMEDAVEAGRAFFEKRAPVFRGR